MTVLRLDTCPCAAVACDPADTVPCIAFAYATVDGSPIIDCADKFPCAATAEGELSLAYAE